MDCLRPLPIKICGPAWETWHSPNISMLTSLYLLVRHSSCMKTMWWKALKEPSNLDLRSGSSSRSFKLQLRYSKLFSLSLFQPVFQLSIWHYQLSNSSFKISSFNKGWARLIAQAERACCPSNYNDAVMLKEFSIWAETQEHGQWHDAYPSGYSFWSQDMYFRSYPDICPWLESYLIITA